MRLTVSYYLARLTYRATQYVLGGRSVEWWNSTVELWNCRAVELSRSEPHDMDCLAPNSRAVLQQLAKGRVGPACPLWHPLPLALINALASFRRHAARVIRAVQHASAWWRLHRGGGVGGCLLSVGGIGGRGGERRSTVRRRCEPTRRPEQRGALFVPHTV